MIMKLNIKMRTANAAIAAIALFLLIVFFGGTPAGGAEINWPVAPYSYISKGEPLRTMLLDFCSSNQLNPVISEKIEGPVNGQFLGFRPKDLFDHITTAYGLVWYYDGSILYLSRADEMISRVMRLSHVSMGKLLTVLKDLNIHDRRYPIKSVRSGNMMYVSGPPRYVELVEETAKLLDVETGSIKKRETLRVFVLKNAWADDRTFYFMDREIRVPGVAAMLRNILAQGGPLDSRAVSGVQDNPNTVPKLKGSGLASAGKPNAEETGAHPPGMAGREAKEPTGSVIQADTRLNAVMIRDSADKMDAYHRLIKMLDVPVGLVEIQAAIIDVNTENLHELGISWRFNTRHLNSGFRATENHVVEDQTLDLAEGLSLVTSFGDAGKFFLSQVEALQQEGKANILARPSVLTLDNQEAHLEHSQTFYVKVEGDEDVDLFKVTAGVVLKVTPHIILKEDQNDWDIRLIVKIEDDSITDESVDEIPVIQNSTVNTQAVVSKNQCLLIGGYSRESTRNLEHKVPVLGDIPLLGLLFRYAEEETSQSERFFFIRPRRISPHAVQEAVPGEIPIHEKISVQDIFDARDRISVQNRTALPDGIARERSNRH